MLVGVFFFFLPSDLLHFLLVQHAEEALLFLLQSVQKGQQTSEGVWVREVLDWWERDPDTLFHKYRSYLFSNAHSANGMEKVRSSNNILITQPGTLSFPKHTWFWKDSHRIPAQCAEEEIVFCECYLNIYYPVLANDKSTRPGVLGYYLVGNHLDILQ